MFLYLSKNKIEALVYTLTECINKIRDKKVSMMRWISFLEKYSEAEKPLEKQRVQHSFASTSNRAGMCVMNTPSSNFDSEIRLKVKPIMSPEITPSKILSPPFCDNSNINGNHMIKNTASPIISNSYHPGNLFKYPNTVINPGFVNPLNRFRPLQCVPKVTHNQIIVQVITSYSALTNSPNYFVKPLNKYTQNHNGLSVNQIGSLKSPEHCMHLHKHNQ